MHRTQSLFLNEQGDSDAVSTKDLSLQPVVNYIVKYCCQGGNRQQVWIIQNKLYYLMTKNIF